MTNKNHPHQPVRLTESTQPTMTEKDIAARMKAAQADQAARQENARRTAEQQEIARKAYIADLHARVDRFTQTLTGKIAILNAELPDSIKLTTLALSDHPEGRFIYYGDRALTYYLTAIDWQQLGFVLVLGRQQNWQQKPGTAFALWAGDNDGWIYQRFSGQRGGSVQFCSYCMSTVPQPAWHAVPGNDWLATWALDSLTAAQFPPATSPAPVFAPTVWHQRHERCLEAMRAEHRNRWGHLPPSGM